MASHSSIMSLDSIIYEHEYQSLIAGGSALGYTANAGSSRLVVAMEESLSFDNDSRRVHGWNGGSGRFLCLSRNKITNV